MPPFGCTWNGLIDTRPGIRVIARSASSENAREQRNEYEQLNSLYVSHDGERSSLNVQDSTVGAMASDKTLIPADGAHRAIFFDIVCTVGRRCRESKPT
jgi:predicted secreted acid phosphatase